MLLPFLRKFNGLLRFRRVPLPQSAAFGIVMQCASVFYIKPIKGHYDCIMRIECRAVLWVFLWVNLLSAVSSLSFHAVTLIWIVSHSHFSYTQRNQETFAFFLFFCGVRSFCLSVSCHFIYIGCSRSCNAIELTNLFYANSNDIIACRKKKSEPWWLLLRFTTRLVATYNIAQCTQSVCDIGDMA